MTSATLAGMAKRGYSREFTPKTERRVQLMIDRVPPTLLNAAKAKAKREGVSLRALILGWLKAWIES
jgi:predicted HicB family RNase H-like nuclease